MKTVLQAKILNPYRRKYAKWYDVIKGHTGVDLAYNYEELPAPVTGKVVALLHQVEMGLVLYLQDQSTGAIHVFAHLSKFHKNVGDLVKRNDIIATTGNTGNVTSGPHLHYEIITLKPVNKIDYIMGRRLSGFKGYNTDPILYVKTRWLAYNIGIDGIQK